MKIFTSEQVRRIDAYTIKNEPIASIDLMERASMQIAAWITEVFDNSHPFVFLIGPGNNGGDGLAVARMLLEKNYLVELFLVRISNKLSADAQTNLERLQQSAGVRITEVKEIPSLAINDPGVIVVDAIFGSGLTRKVDGLAREAINYANELPNLRIAIDIPSGLFGEDNADNDPEAILQADFTLALQAPSLSFFYPENQDYVGIWEVLPIGLHPQIMEEEQTAYRYLLADYVSTLLKSRRKFAHKGTFGHCLLIAGCYGMMGAAVLAARACLRSGAGLVTSHVPRFGYKILQTAVPEVLISIDESDIIFSGAPGMDPFSAVGIGPGLGCKLNTGKALHELIKTVRVPLVMDADALNILSEHPEWMGLLPEDTILTPHPREFERLAGKAGNGHARIRMQIDFAVKHKVYVVLKGAHTSIACPDGSCWFNTSGNPGMATAGSGDVLTGIILSLLGQGYVPRDAAILGVYLHGLAGDLAAEASSEESLIAGDIIESLGFAFQYLKDVHDENNI
ncbi:MAG: NAD(P)H-hydrate dehydratase [Bacteroidales bacterium]|nr:NAD(P)H-hydrate dehydratase [Bacteroidales bacterium]